MHQKPLPLLQCSSTEMVNDLKFTVTQAVEPVQKGIQKLHNISQKIKKHEKEKQTKDDSCIATSSTARRVIHGIDDPLLHGSVSDSGTSRKKKHHQKYGYTSAESGGESSSDQNYGGIQVRGRRWLTKNIQERKGQKVIALKNYAICTPLPEHLELFNSLQHHSSARRKLKYLLQQSPSGAFSLSAEFMCYIMKALAYSSLLSMLLHIVVLNGV